MGMARAMPTNTGMVMGTATEPARSVEDKDTMKIDPCSK